LWRRLPSHETEIRLNNSLTDINEHLHIYKNTSKQIAQNEYYVLLETLRLRINLGGLCHKKVHTHVPGRQCAAVSTQHESMMLPPQKNEPPITMAAWYGNWPAVAGWPPIIFGAWGSGAPSEIHMKPEIHMKQLVLIPLTTKFAYMPTQKIPHNS
jgi:hypothetical protein